MNTESSKTTWNGLEAVALKAYGYEALIVPKLGANVISLVCRREGVLCDIIRTPESEKQILDDPYAYGIPILFPANRIQDGTYTYDGVTYTYPRNYPNDVHIHGILHNNAWTLKSLEHDEDCAKAVFEISGANCVQIAESIPIDVVFQIENILSQDGLLQRFRVINNSAHVFPFGLAYHTAFRVPFTEGGKIDDVRLHVPIEAASVDDKVDHLPTGEKRALNEFERQIADAAGGKPLGQVVDCLYTAVPGTCEAVMRDSRTERSVVYRAGTDCHYWILWNKTATEGFVAIEPQTWLTNAIKMDESKHDDLGIIYVAPKGTWTGDTSIFIR